MTTNYWNNPAINQTSLKNILSGVEEFKHKLDNPSKQTQDQILGTAVHTLILELANANTILKKPEIVCDSKTVEGKIWKFFCNGATPAYFPLMKGKRRAQIAGQFYEVDGEESQFMFKIYEEYKHYFTEQNKYLMISEEDYDTAYKMAEAIHKNEDSLWLLKQSTGFEKEYYFKYQGINCKAKLDEVTPDFPVDLKTTSLHPKFFNYHNEFDSKPLYYKLLEYGYFFQAFFYLLAFNSKEGVEVCFDDIVKKDYYMIFARSDAPYAVYPLQIQWKHILDGKAQVELAMYLYKNCLENNPRFIPQNRIKLL